MPAVGVKLDLWNRNLRIAFIRKRAVNVRPPPDVLDRHVRVGLIGPFAAPCLNGRFEKCAGRGDRRLWAVLTSDANIAGASLEVRKFRAKALGQEIVLVFPLRKAVQFSEGPGRSVDASAGRNEV